MVQDFVYSQYWCKFRDGYYDFPTILKDNAGSFGVRGFDPQPRIWKFQKTHRKWEYLWTSHILST